MFVQDLSLSSFLVDSPTKKQSAVLSEVSHPATATVIVTQAGSLLGTVVHFAESSRDSAVLAGVSNVANIDFEWITCTTTAVHISLVFVASFL